MHHSPRFNPRLESLRGLAALAVCFTHSLGIYRIDNNPGIWNVPIQHQSFWAACLDLLNAIFNPHAAVILFFILSGYVLSQSLAQGQAMMPKSVFGFYIRRVLRILPMMWASLIIAFGLAQMDHSVSRELVSDFWPNAFEPKVYLLDLLNNFALVDFKVSPVTWTMRVELLGSLLMPAIFFYVSRTARPLQLVMLAVLFGVAYLGKSDFQYMVCFYVGALLTEKRLIDAFVPFAQPLVWIGLLICTSFRLWIALQNHPTIINLGETIGAAMIVAGVLSGATRFRFLESGPCRIVGRLSYSLYLLHMPILGAVAVGAFALNIYPALPGTAANVLLFLVSTLLALACAAVTYRCIEKPGIALGKKLTAFDPA